MTVRVGDLDEIAQVRRAVTRQVGLDVGDLAVPQQQHLAQARLAHHGNRYAFQAPCRVPRCTLYIQVDVDVRVGPLHPGDNAVELDDLADIELSRHGVMRARRSSCKRQQRAQYDSRPDSNCHYLPPPSTLPSGMITSPGFIPVGQLPRYFMSMTVTASVAPRWICISICEEVSPGWDIVT